MTANNGNEYCVIGAGAAGLAATKNLKQLGIPVVALEREDEIGGNWNYGKPFSSIYRSVHLITSKRFTEYPDFPLPDDYPTYINQAQAFQYLRSYARNFGLYENIEFNRTVAKIEPVQNGAAWDVVLSGGERRRFRGVLIANGHLWDPVIPNYPGQFDGTTLHSSKYKTPDVFTGKNVLVVGAGNSGCDIAVEAGHHAAQTFHSTRRGYYYWPKYLFGMPSDQWAEIPLALRMPLWARRFFGKLILNWFNAGTAEQYGLPKPDHKLFEAHFIINSTLFYHLGHGDIKPKPDISHFQRDKVVFADGSQERIDVIVYATGFNLSFPFIDRALLNWKDNRPDFYLNIFHPAYDNLFMLGLFQTSTGNWPLFDYQSQLVARYLHAIDHQPAKAAWLEKRRLHPQPKISGGIKFTASGRHVIECEHFQYRSQLRRHIRKLDPGKQAGERGEYVPHHRPQEAFQGISRRQPGQLQRGSGGNGSGV